VIQFVSDSFAKIHRPKDWSLQAGDDLTSASTFTSDYEVTTLISATAQGNIEHMIKRKWSDQQQIMKKLQFIRQVFA